jgi:hypothetical protein
MVVVVVVVVMTWTTTGIANSVGCQGCGVVGRVIVVRFLVGEGDFPLYQSVQTSSGPISLLFSEYTGAPTPMGSVVSLATTASSAPTTVYRHGVHKGDFTIKLPATVIVVVVVVVTVTTVLN